MPKPTLRTLPSRIPVLDTRIAKPPPKTPDPFYNTTEWRALMRSLIEQRGRQCQQCGRQNTRIFGDHIGELKDGGPALEPSNIKLLCGSCHTLKTAAARAERHKG